MRRFRSALLVSTLLLVAHAPRFADGQNGNVLIPVVDDLTPTVWSDSAGNHCPPGWQPLTGMFLCKHFSTLNRFAPGGQRVLEDLKIVPAGLSCPEPYQKLGDALCVRFGTPSTTDIYTLTTDVRYGGVYANAGEGSGSTAPTCGPGWDLVSDPYQGGIGMCLRRITVLIQVPG